VTVFTIAPEYAVGDMIRGERGGLIKLRSPFTGFEILSMGKKEKEMENVLGRLKRLR